MEKYSIVQIKNAIFKWYSEKLLNKDNDFEMELIKNEEESLSIDLTFENCLGGIKVVDSDFAPYKYVSFEVLDLNPKTNQPELVYFFYDSEILEEYEVIEELEYGLNFCTKYSYGVLEKQFVNKKGKININNKKFNLGIYISDWEKINATNIIGEFVCTGTEFQYLVLTNNLLTLRIIPEWFDIIKE